MTRKLKWTVWAVVAGFLLVGCDGSEVGLADRHSASEWAMELPAPARFDWTDQPIAFSPPPDDWEFQKQTSGGLFGARFVKYESGGQSIEVAEFKKVGDRDKCTELRELLGQVDKLARRGFTKALSRARPYAGSKEILLAEQDAFTSANERLSEAQTAVIMGQDREAARDSIEAALWHLQTVDLELDDVIDQALFTGKGWGKNLGTVEIGELEETEVAGFSARALDYTIDPRDREGLIQGRDVYVEHNNRLFVARFRGVDQYLPLFEAVVASISFPAAACEHGAG